MKKGLFALMALVIAIAMTSCDNNEKFKQCTLSVTDVTEHSIDGRCEYISLSKNDGYKLFLSYTDQISDMMRQLMIESCHESDVYHESVSFAFEELTSNQKYYVLAVTYQEKDGKVSIISVESLPQATMVSNSENVSVVSATKTGATLTVRAADENYEEGFFDLGVTDNEYYYSASVKFERLGNVTSAGTDDCYTNGNLLCIAPLESNKNETVSTFYGYKPTDEGFEQCKATVTIKKESINSTLLPLKIRTAGTHK